MADIEVESLADDLESDVTPVAEADEVRERLVDFDMFIHETDQVRLFRANERELSDHRLARPDLPGPMQFLDLPPARGSELLQDRLGHVPSRHESRYARCSSVSRSILMPRLLSSSRATFRSRSCGTGYTRGFSSAACSAR